MFPCFLEQENILGSLYPFPAPDLQSTLFQGAQLPFNGQRHLGGALSSGALRILGAPLAFPTAQGGRCGPGKSLTSNS